MSKVTIHQLAKEFEDATFYTFENQYNAAPVVFYYDGQFGFSPGSTTGGMSELVYNNKADIVIETEQLKEIMDEYEYTKEQRVVLIEEQLKNHLEGVKQ